MRYSKKIVALVVVLNVLFAVVVLYLNSIDKYVSDELVRGWFIFTSIELLALAGIKIKEVGKEGH
jgi:hypothetical protein